MIDWREILDAIERWLESLFHHRRYDRVHKFDFVISQ